MTLAVLTTGDESLAPDFISAPVQNPFVQPAATLAVVPPPAAPAATPVVIKAQAPTGGGALPQFEKANVTKTEIKVTGACGIETFGEISVGLDDRLRAVGEFRVVKVMHYVNKEGDVVRQHILAAIGELVLSPWDSTDPSDDGIVRVRP